MNLPSKPRSCGPVVVGRPGGPTGHMALVGVEAPDAVVLTFDDGPDPIDDALLEHLADLSYGATFFVLLSRAPRYPQQLSALAASHEIGLHGIDHSDLRHLSPSQTEARIREGRDRLEQLTGRAVRWFRAPYGRCTSAAYEATAAAGMRVAAWQVELRDWLLEPADAIDEVADAPIGALVLCHDGHAGLLDAGTDPGAPPERLAVLRSVLDRYASRGLNGIGIDEALGRGSGRWQSWTC